MTAPNRLTFLPLSNSACPVYLVCCLHSRISHSHSLHTCLFALIIPLNTTVAFPVSISFLLCSPSFGALQLPLAAMANIFLAVSTQLLRRRFHSYHLCVHAKKRFASVDGDGHGMSMNVSASAIAILWVYTVSHIFNMSFRFTVFSVMPRLD